MIRINPASFSGVVALCLAAPAVAQTTTLSEPPSVRTPANPKCACRGDEAASAVRIKGLVVDAEVSLGEDGRSPADRQATIFNVYTSDDATLRGRTKVWHDVKADQCGVTFDYGRKYSIAARRTEAGGLETDFCLATLLSGG